MSEYLYDTRDLHFGLFEVLGMEASDELKEVLAQFYKFVATEVWPTRAIGDKEGTTLTPEGVKAPHCYHHIKKLFYDNGWFALGMPEDVGGMDVPNAVTVACSSCMNGANVAFNNYLALSKGALNLILKLGTATQKSIYVDKMISGTWGGTMCLTEAGAGSDVGAVVTSAEKLPSGKYSIKGTKTFITSGESDLYCNNIHLVLARTSAAIEGTKGLSLFIVPRFDVETGKSNNVICTKVEDKIGIHSSATCEMTFGEFGECVGELLGNEMDGMVNMFLLMNEARLLCGIQGESQANSATLLSLKYARERVQFAKEIYKHPDVSRLLLKMQATSRGMRALILYVANLFDHADKNPEVNTEIALLTPICKAYCSDHGVNVALDAIQVHGGYGLCRDYGIEQYVRDTKVAAVYEGTNGIQALDFVMRKILRDKGSGLQALLEKITKEVTLAEQFGKQFGAQQWSEELQLFKTVLQELQLILKKFAQISPETILAYASDTLTFCGHLIVGWQLLCHANVAATQLSRGPEDEENKHYLQSKLLDFRIFCRHLLTQNLGIAHNILRFGLPLNTTSH
ncbi:MAG: acyl-CoA dehydrogenase [Oligoflexia bacterium]|nr:acyl-CoA dehydrogenase [Oligoflexia bacterium]MBF0365228.1 acyl-CoA dehydrogenase [Oligoflexia bacterium]